ncbi:MAG: tyrosine-type recombinase/integrase [Beijerinckiaceae bacterium]
MGRLCQNVRRRNGVYWFTKKLRTPDGVARVEFSLNTREPRLATMVGAQVNAQFYVLSERVLSGQSDIETFRETLAEIAAEVAQSRRNAMFEALLTSHNSAGALASNDELDAIVRTEVNLGRVIEMIARHGEALRDTNFLIEALDEYGFEDQELAVYAVLIQPHLDECLGVLAGLTEGSGEATTSLLERRLVMKTVGKAITQSAEKAGEKDLVGLDDIVSQAVGSVYSRPVYKHKPQAPEAPALSPPPAATPPNALPPPVVSVDEHPFVGAVDTYLKRAKKGDARRDAKDVVAVGRLFSEFLIEQDVRDLRQIRQHHLSGFHDLFDELPTHWGKSSQDTCLADYRQRGKSLPKEKRGLSAKTLNKHFGNIGQVIASIRATGGVVGAPGEVLDPSLLHIRIKDRGRNLRNPFDTDELAALFNLPVFTGCAGWRRQEPFKPGAHVFHRALYFAPMLLYYTGARRDEIFGLIRDDVHLDAPIPYIHIRENSQRQIKNVQSERKIPIHGEVLRLGFAQYITKIASLKYELVFPDLYSTTTSSPLGDRLYDEIAGALAEAVPEEGRRKTVLHSLRHTVGSTLKGEGIVAEKRADLLGHKGRTATEETYASQSTLESLRELIHRLPVATAHLAPSPIRLVPWVERKEPAPWGRPARGGKAKTTD